MVSGWWGPWKMAAFMSFLLGVVGDCRGAVAGTTVAS
jgi:hypothetical protein